MKRNRRAGTSLIELLVVIVVFLIGILAILQIFPGGLRVLATSRSNAVARQLARTEMERITSRPDILPEMILPVRYSFVGGTTIDTFVDGSPNPNDLGPPRAGTGDGIDANGNLIIGSNQIGRWDMVVGANRIRRVVGEGGRVPAPRQVGGYFGGLMLLQFAPISWDPTPPYDGLLKVYGNDMVRRDGAPNFRVRPWEYFIEDAEDSAAVIYVPLDAATVANYRLSMSAWISNGTNTFRRTIVDSTVGPVGPGTGFANFPLSGFAALQPGETFLGAEWESIRLARQFRRLDAADVFTSSPYEFKLLDARLGTLLFNPAGYNFQEVRPGRRIPLVARVNYDVFDWRIIRDDFRINASYPFQQRLQLSNLMIPSSTRADGKTYAGLDIPVQNGSGGTDRKSVV